MVKIALYAILAVVGVMLIGALAWNFDPFGRLKHAKQEAAVATQQAANNGAAAQEIDRHATEIHIIREKSDHAVEVVRALPGAETPLDPGRRSTLCEQLASVRGSAVCIDDPGSANLP